jgi:hypothetical protein
LYDLLEITLGPTFGTFAFRVISTMLWSLLPMGTGIDLEQSSAAFVKI